MNSVVVAVLLLVAATVQVHGGTKVACKASGARAVYINGKTASSDDYRQTTSVPQQQRYNCKSRCHSYCKDEGPIGYGDRWPNCKAFSSYVKAGGTCYCYGWKTIPEWYSDSDYISGHCEN